MNETKIKQKEQTQNKQTIKPMNPNGSIIFKQLKLLKFFEIVEIVEITEKLLFELFQLFQELQIDLKYEIMTLAHFIFICFFLSKKEETNKTNQTKTKSNKRRKNVQPQKT